MKQLLYTLLVIYLVACTSSQKLYDKGKYEAALKKSARKLKRHPEKFKEQDVFYVAYRALYLQDSTMLAKLDKNSPLTPEKKLTILIRMKQRQDLALSLPPSANIKVNVHDFDKEIAEAKLSASKVAYNKGLEYLVEARQNFDRTKAQQAYTQFKKAKNYGNPATDLDALINESELLGTKNVLFKVENNTQVVMPQSVVEAVNTINVEDLSRKWINYDNTVDTTLFYDYSIILNIKQIQVSPEVLNQKQYTETKEIEDGFEYDLDENGNVKKDSLGNDIKIPKYKTISCNVTDFFQRKSAIISGMLEYYDNRTQKLMKQEPITAEAIFENAYATAKGNLNALKPDTRKKLNLKPVPFPPDDQLVLQASNTLKTMVRNILTKNKNYLK